MIIIMDQIAKINVINVLKVLAILMENVIIKMSFVVIILILEFIAIKHVVQVLKNV